jgi:hypothetical protein
MPLRNTYVAQRALARMQQRGEAMVLRRISLMSGAEPFQNPPNVSADLTVVTAGTYGSPPAAFFNLGGSSVIGRLAAGDQIVCAGPPQTVWTVLHMPIGVLTNDDGIPQVNDAGAPVFGSPPVYNADTLGWINSFPVVPVAYANGPVMEYITLVLDTEAGTLMLDGGGFAAKGLAVDDEIKLTGVLAPNTALNGVTLTATAVSDTVLTVSGLPGGLTGGALSYVTLTVVGGNETNPTSVIGQAVSFVYQADVTCYGKAMSYRQMTAMGWVEVDGIGLLLAAHLIPNPPQVNDQILLTSSGGEKRAIVNTGRQFIDGTQFLYPVQVA